MQAGSKPHPHESKHVWEGLQSPKRLSPCYHACALRPRELNLKARAVRSNLQPSWPESTLAERNGADSSLKVGSAFARLRSVLNTIKDSKQSLDASIGGHVCWRDPRRVAGERTTYSTFKGAPIYSSFHHVSFYYGVPLHEMQIEHIHTSPHRIK